LFKSHMLELMRHCPESIRKPLLPLFAVDLFLAAIITLGLLFQPFGNKNTLVAWEFRPERAAVLNISGVSFGNCLVYKYAVGESELIRSQRAEKLFELCRSAGVAVGSAGRIRRNLTAKFVTDLSRSLGVLFFGSFLFLTFDGRLKVCN